MYLITSCYVMGGYHNKCVGYSKWFLAPAKLVVTYIWESQICVPCRPAISISNTCFIVFSVKENVLRFKCYILLFLQLSRCGTSSKSVQSLTLFFMSHSYQTCFVLQLCLKCTTHALTGLSNQCMHSPRVTRREVTASWYASSHTRFPTVILIYVSPNLTNCLS
jgi:hypothetical protein